MTAASEEWKTIAEYEGLYEVSSTGKVKSLRKGRLMKPQKTQKGYLSVDLWKGGEKKRKRIHRLVLEAFTGSCPDGMECRHIDGNKMNNSVKNLRWGTSSENTLDLVRHGSHNNARKTHCPRGHELTPKNIPNWIKRVGRRQCLACYRGYDYIRDHPELADRFQEISDQYYAEIAAATN